jgi:hypothetical protein
VFLRSPSCSPLLWYPPQCYPGQSFLCHSLNMAIPCKLLHIYRVIYKSVNILQIRKKQTAQHITVILTPKNRKKLSKFF